MKSLSLPTAIRLVLGCWAALSAGVCLAEDDEDDAPKTSEILLGIQALDDTGDSENLQGWGDGLDDAVILESLRLTGGTDNGFYSVEGRDIGQRDQNLDLSAGIYGKFRVDASWDEQFRNYSNGTFLGTRTAPGYWSVPDSVQGLLEPGFLPQNGNPTAAGQASLRELLANAPEVPLQQQRETADVALEFSLSPESTLRAGFTHQDRDGLRAISNGGYSRTATGATAIGGLGENFRLFGLELPMPIDYTTTGMSFGADYRTNRWFVDFNFQYTKFENNIGELVFDNPLLLNGQNNRVGGAAMRQIDLAPDWEGRAFSLTGGLSDLPLRSRLTLTYSNDHVSQDDAFLPYTVNTALRDDAGNPVTDLARPANDLDGDVTTELFNLVLSSRPARDWSTNLRFNRYDYQNDSASIVWDGWAAVGESSWRDYDGSIAAQQPFRNRVPEYTRTRSGFDSSYHFSSAARLTGEYEHEQFDRNADRYADTSEDSFKLTLTLLPADFMTLKIGGKQADREIDGEYAAHLENGVQEEWEELRMFDQAARERTSLDLDAGFDIGEAASIGLSMSRFEDTYDEEFYGLQDFKGVFGAVDFTWYINTRMTASAWYNRDLYESNQHNRGKSNGLGAGAFALPENDFDTYIEDDTDAYGLGFDATLVPDKWTLKLSWDRSDTVGKIETTNPNLVPGLTTSGARAFAWPDTRVTTQQFVIALNYQWSESLGAGLRYTWVEQDISDFAADLARTYYGTPTDAQGNNPSHFILMNAHPFDYKANVLTATLSYRF